MNKYADKAELNEFFDNFTWCKTREAAEILQVSPKRIRKWVYQGKIEAKRLLGRSLRFKRSDLKLLFK